MAWFFGKNRSMNEDQTKPQSLRAQIKNVSELAAKTLNEAGVDDDEQLFALTREDLNELIPGANHFQTRRKIMDLLKTSRESRRPNVDTIIKSLKDLIPEENLKKAMVPGSVLYEYRCMLKNAEKQLESALGFLHPHVVWLDNCLAKDHGTVQENVPQCGKPISSGLVFPKEPAPTSSPFRLLSFSGRSQMPGGKKQDQVKIHVLLYGKTQNIHRDFLSRVDLPTKECGVDECSVILAFCPVVTRMLTDIQEVLKTIPSHKETILVVMHHTFNASYAVATFNTEVRSKLKTVHCLFYESQLLECNLNTQSIDTVRAAMLEML